MKKVQGSGVAAEFKFVVEGASQDFLDSVAKKANECGVKVKAVEE